MDWNESKTYGNMAENIVEMLIKSMPDWKCIKFGVENHVSELKKLLREQKLISTTLKVKSMPDFIAINTKTKETFFIEVKYRSYIDKKVPGSSIYRLPYKSLNDYLEYWPETKLIIVHPYKPYFILIELNDVKKSMGNKSKTENGEWKHTWDFGGIEKDIKKIFPDLKEHELQKARKLIPSSNKND